MFGPGGSFFVWVGREGRTDRPPRWQSVRSGFWECEVWWMQWNEVLAVFVEGFLLTFAGGVVILKIHIWEHSGPFGYLIPIWLVV